MQGYYKKLALWNTKTFRPMMFHEELAPIMAILGFTTHLLPPAPGQVPWREYVQGAYSPVQVPCSKPLVNNAPPLPRPRLPAPRIDGLHVDIYRTFVDDVCFYIGEEVFDEHFHVRGMLLHHIYDNPKSFSHMEADEGFYAYRYAILDPFMPTVRGRSSYNIANNNNNANTTRTQPTTTTITTNNKNNNNSEDDNEKRIAKFNKPYKTIMKKNSNITTGHVVLLKDVNVLIAKKR